MVAGASSVGDGDAVAAVVGRETAQVSVAPVPGARCEIGGEPLRSALARLGREKREPRHTGLHVGVEVGLGPGPERGTEAVHAVAWHEHRSDFPDP
jgi:hypothetical protein